MSEEDQERDYVATTDRENYSSDDEPTKYDDVADKTIYEESIYDSDDSRSER